VLASGADPATVTSTLQAAGYLPAREDADGSLLLTRPAVRRAVNRPFPVGRPPAEPDVAAIVAALRRAPAPAPPPPRPAAPAWPRSTLAGAPRPAEIARGPRAVRALLAHYGLSEQAHAEDDFAAA